MEKIFLYIKQGKGYGLLFLLATAIITTIIFSFSLKTVLNDIKPKALLVAEDFLPIEIKNKEIVSHPNTYKRTDLNFGANDKDNFILPVILDTQNPSEELTKEKTAIIITKKYFYITSPSDIKKLEYTDGTYDINYFKSFLDKSIQSTTSTFSLLAICLFFIILLLKSLILTFLNSLILKIRKTPINKEILMRLSALCISFIELLNLLIAKTINLEINELSTFLLAFLLSLIYLKNNLEKQE